MLEKLFGSDSLIRYILHSLKYRNEMDSYMALRQPLNAYSFFLFKSYGEKNKDKLIYNILIDGGRVGFFAYYRYVLSYLYICDRFGFIPFIDIKNTLYNDKSEENLWDLFYCQPFNLCRSDISSSYNVIICNSSHVIWADKLNDSNSSIVGGYQISDRYIKEMSNVLSRYVIYNDSTAHALEKDFQMIIGSKKTVGVHYRGNSYRNGNLGHPVALEVQDYYKDIDQCLANGFEQIFIATDDLNALKCFINRYGNKVVCFNDTLRSDDNIDAFCKPAQRENNGYKLAYEVIRDMYTLARCNGLICGNSQVTIASRIENMSQGKLYDYLSIIDHGIYKKDNKRKLRDFNRKLNSINKT